MSEQFILQFIPERIRQLDYSKYHIRYRDFVVASGRRINIVAYNDLYFIVGDPPGLIVESAYGVYDTTNDAVKENIHQHRGEISVFNPGSDSKRIKFIQVVIVN